jgi:anti-sigma factor (TIGR02949 family)
VTDCDFTRRTLHAYVDGELVGDERQAVAAHLESCPECRRAYEQEARLVSTIKTGLPFEAAPHEVRERIERLARGAVARRRRPWSIAAALGAAALLAFLVFLRPRPPLGIDGPSEFVAVAVDSHLRYAAGRLPLEVRSESPDEVSRFFTGRVPFHLTLPDYPIGPGERKFYNLEGGRLVSLTGDYAAYVAYRMDGRPISLVAASSERVRPSGRETVTSGSLTFHLDAVSGLNVITWTDKGLTYALVSDLSVSGERSCLVCHGSPSERKKIPGFAPRT